MLFPAKLRSLEAAAASVRRDTAAELSGSADGAACEAVCRRVIALVDAEFATERAAGAQIACAPGCAFCCHQRVGVFEHEAVALLHHLRARAAPAVAAAIEQRILANAGTIDGLTAEQHRAANLRCAFLVDGRCAAYEARPSACARYHSLSRARCEYSYTHPQHIGTPRNSRPAVAELQALGAALDAALQEALAAAGRPAAKGELHQTLRALLGDSSASPGVTPSSAP